MMTTPHRSTSPAPELTDPDDRQRRPPDGDGAGPTAEPGTTADDATGRSPGTPAPGAGTLAVLALAWLLAMLSSARQAVGSSAETASSAVARAAAALELPQVISASLVAGLAVGLAAGNLLARWRPAAHGRALPRFAAGTAAGLVTGLIVATPILLRYGGLPSVQLLGGAVAAAATLGGALAGLRRAAVVAAGATGALGVFAVGLVERVFEGDLRTLFGARDSAESVVTASGWVAFITSLVAGAVAGVLGYLYLRRSGPAGLRWPAYLAAGAMPGLLAVVAEAVTRLGGARLFQLVSESSAGDEAILSYFHAARLNRTLIILFAGAVVTILLFGRTLRPAGEASPDQDAPGDPDAPADHHPADEGPGHEGPAEDSAAEDGTGRARPAE